MFSQNIKPGQILLDTEGKRVQAHGGSLFFDNDTFYFYGENKEKTNGKGKIWSWGVRYYSSKDLYNWRDEGLLIPPDLSDKKSILHPYHYLDRPHIIRSSFNGKYVCWIKFSKIKESCFAVLIADKFQGPYKLIKSYFRPFGLEVGDFDIHDYGDRGVYLYFTNGKKGIIGCKLTPDCTDVIGEYKRYYSGLIVPYCREGVAVFEANNNIYMFTSGMTGYIPNKSHVAILSSPLGELKDLGDPHGHDSDGSSYHSQISSVFKHPLYDNFYIALADRWIPSLHFTKEEAEKKDRALAACCSKKYHAKLSEILFLGKLPFNCKKVNTSIADYVWLPIDISKEKPMIEWRDGWTIEQVASEYKKKGENSNGESKNIR